MTVGHRILDKIGDSCLEHYLFEEITVLQDQCLKPNEFYGSIMYAIDFAILIKMLGVVCEKWIVLINAHVPCLSNVTSAREPDRIIR